MFLSIIGWSCLLGGIIFVVAFDKPHYSLRRKELLAGVGGVIFLIGCIIITHCCAEKLH